MLILFRRYNNFRFVKLLRTNIAAEWNCSSSLVMSRYTVAAELQLQNGRDYQNCMDTNQLIVMPVIFLRTRAKAQLLHAYHFTYIIPLIDWHFLYDGWMASSTMLLKPVIVYIYQYGIAIVCPDLETALKYFGNLEVEKVLAAAQRNTKIYKNIGFKPVTTNLL